MRASECQKKDWKEHKQVCRPSTSGKAAGEQRWVPATLISRNLHSYTIPNRGRHYRSSPESNAAATAAIAGEFWVKIQLPLDPLSRRSPHEPAREGDDDAAPRTRACLVYNKERTVTGQLTPENCACFEQVVAKIKSEGPMGLKGFFKARSAGRGDIEIDPTVISVKTW